LAKNGKNVAVDFLKSSWSAENHPALKQLNRSKNDLTGEFVDCLNLFAEALGTKLFDRDQFLLFWSL